MKKSVQFHPPIDYSFDFGKTYIELVCDIFINIIYVIIFCFLNIFDVNA